MIRKPLREKFYKRLLTVLDEIGEIVSNKEFEKINAYDLEYALSIAEVLRVILTNLPVYPIRKKEEHN